MSGKTILQQENQIKMHPNLVTDTKTGFKVPVSYSYKIELSLSDDQAKQKFKDWGDYNFSLHDLTKNDLIFEQKQFIVMHKKEIGYCAKIILNLSLAESLKLRNYAIYNISVSEVVR